MAFWNIFRRKPKQQNLELPEDLRKDLASKPPAYQFQQVETAGADNMRAKLDLVVTQMESMNIRLETMNQRMERLERMLQEIWAIARK